MTDRESPQIAEPERERPGSGPRRMVQVVVVLAQPGHEVLVVDTAELGQ